MNPALKVLLVTNIPTPYRIPLFNELSKQLRLKGIKLKVAFGALGYERRKWEIAMSECKFDYTVMSKQGFIWLAPERPIFTYKGLIRMIVKEKPQIIVVAGFSIASIKVWLLTLAKRIEYIVWSGSIHRKGHLESVARKFQRRVIVSRARGFIAYGTKAKEYLSSLGANEKRIYLGINTVDTEYFRNRTDMIGQNLDSNEKIKHILYVGHLTKGKRIDKLFYVVKALSERRQDFVLDVVGSGPETENLGIMAKHMGLNNFVILKGFRQRKDIPYYLARACVFLFPSEYDIWGLVLVEAMAAGLPCIASNHAGATKDLIEDGVTGFAMNFSDAEKVVEKIDWLLENPKKAEEIGKNASLFIKNQVNLKISASGFVKAILGTLDIRRNIKP